MRKKARTPGNRFLNRPCPSLPPSLHLSIPSFLLLTFLNTYLLKTIHIFHFDQLVQNGPCKTQINTSLEFCFLLYSEMSVYLIYMYLRPTIPHLIKVPPSQNPFTTVQCSLLSWESISLNWLCCLTADHFSWKNQKTGFISYASVWGLMHGTK